jgi:hypothetical protein
LLLAGCAKPDAEEQQPRLLDGTVVFPPHDTVAFSLPATAHRCTEPRTLLIEAVGPEGNGVLVRLHYADSLVSRSYRIVPPGDTTPGAAVVAVRYLLHDATRQFTFDTGAVQVGRTGAKIGGRIQGSGVESAIRTPTRIDYHDIVLPEASDTAVSCAFQP